MGTPPTPAMLFNLPSDAQQMTMRIVFVLCCSFIPAKFTNKWKCCLPVCARFWLRFTRSKRLSKQSLSNYLLYFFFLLSLAYLYANFFYILRIICGYNLCGVLHDYDLQVLTLAVLPSKFRENGLSSTAGVREFQVLQGKAYYWTIQTIHSHYRAKWMWWVDIWWGTIKASFQGLFVLFQSFKAYKSCSCMAFCISLSG